jgi:hypothetical protein
MINKRLRAIVTLLCLAQLVGCTSMRPVESAGSSPVEQLKPGDHLVIYEKTGRVVDMTLLSIDGDTLSGILAADPKRTIKVDVVDIEKVQREDIDSVKTTLAVAGVGTALYYLFYLLVIFAIVGPP